MVEIIAGENFTMRFFDNIIYIEDVKKIARSDFLDFNKLKNKSILISGPFLS